MAVFGYMRVATKEQLKMCDCGVEPEVVKSKRFECLVRCPKCGKEMKMYTSNQEREEINMRKTKYPPGTRVELISMGSDPAPIEPGTRGTVDVVDDIGTLHCTFDNGRKLGLCPGEDKFRVL